MSYCDTTKIRQNIQEMLRAPRRVAVAQAAEEHIKVEVAGGNGPWERDVAPYMVEPMDCASSRLYQSVIFAGPARTGKTQALVNGILSHAVQCDPVGDMLCVFPTEENARKYGRTDLRKLHRNSPTMEAMLSPRAHDTAITSTVYRNGMAVFLGHPSSGQLAQTTFRRVVFSDYDSMTSAVGSEGEPFWLGAKRVETFMSGGICVAESSPKRYQTDARWAPKTPHEAPPVDGGILTLYNMGDRRRWYWTCMACKDPFEAPALPQFDDLDNIDKAAATAIVACPHCGFIHTPADKRKLNISGRWIVDEKVGYTSIASFWMLGCAAGFQTWSGLVAGYLRGKRRYEQSGDEESLKKSYNTDQGLPYLPATLASVRSAIDLLRRLESYERAVVPKGAKFVVATVDVQSRRFVVQIHAYGAGGECWIIDRYDLAISDRKSRTGDPLVIDPAARFDDWLLLVPRVLDRVFPLADDPDKVMPIALMAVDSGGKEGVTARAYDFWRWCRSKGLDRRIRLFKGDALASDKTPTVHLTYPDSTRKDRRTKARGEIPLHLLNTLVLKDELDGNLKLEEAGPRYIHLPDWMTQEEIEELTAEVRKAKKWEKIQSKANNETWDLLVYARALTLILGANKWGPNWERIPAWLTDKVKPIIQNVDKTENIEAKEEKIEINPIISRRNPSPKPKRTVFATKW